MPFEVCGLSSPREVAMHFHFPHSKHLWKDFEYCLSQSVVGKYELEANESPTYFQIFKAAFEALEVLLPDRKITATLDSKQDYNYCVIPYGVFEDCKAPRTDSSGAGPSPFIQPGG